MDNAIFVQTNTEEICLPNNLGKLWCATFDENVNNNINDTTNGTTSEQSLIEFNGIDNNEPQTFQTNYKIPVSESSDSLEVDPKSQLANKTIFKSDNPNLSIIEINDSSNTEEENSVYLIESDEENGSHNLQEHIKKANALIHSSKQKLNELELQNSSSNIQSDITSNSNNNTNDYISDDITKGENLEKSLVLSTSNEKGKNKTVPRVIKVYDTIEEFEQNLPKTVTILTTPFGSKVYLVGTAHFSEESQDDVSYVIRNVLPDIVMVELCPSRIHVLKHDENTLLEEAKNFNMAKIRSIINANGVVNGIFFILLLHMSAHIAKELGMAPGGEFRRAFSEVNRIPGCMLHLGDRPINITLQRALRALTLWQTIKLVWRLTSTESISIEDVEEVKKRDLLEKLMQQMAGQFPAFSDVFVRERDLYLCHSLQVACLPYTQPNGLQRPVRVVGVVGIGHATGIAKHWGTVDPKRIPEILEIPNAKISTRIFKYSVKYGFVCLMMFGVYKYTRPKIGKFF